MKMNFPWEGVMGVNENVNSKSESFSLTAWKEKKKNKSVRIEFNSENKTWNWLPWPNHAIKVKRAKLLVIYSFLENNFSFNCYETLKECL